MTKNKVNDLTIERMIEKLEKLIKQRRKLRKGAKLEKEAAKRRSK